MDNHRPFDERRSFSRINIPEVRANFKLLNLRTYSTYLEKNPEPVENISLGGMLLKSYNHLEKKTPVAIDLKVGTENYLMRIFGRIAWIKEVEKNDYLMGISFSWWNKEEDKKRIRELIVKNKF
ncbi:MAG: PilZ domain-containing protein [Candidatus Omnitrophota bacterium]